MKFIAMGARLLLGVALLSTLNLGTDALAEELDCLIEPFRVVTISSQEVGLLETVNVDRGDLVTKGQILAQLDSNLESATNAVSHARAKLTNQKLANLELRRASAEIERRMIKSPITGVVLERSLHPGEFAKQDPILKLAQLDPLRVEVFAPVALLGKVTVGMEAQVFPEKPVGAPIRLLSRWQTKWWMPLAEPLEFDWNFLIKIMRYLLD